MDYEGLRTFLAVYRERGFSGAARALNRTQPAISSRIRLLEEELQVRLFERTTQGIVLSQAGRVLLEYGERAIAAMQDAENAIRSLRVEMTGPLALAMVGTLASTKLTAILKQFAAMHPSVELRLRTARSTEISDLVRNGDVTVGLRYDRDRSRDLHFEEIGADKMVVVCPTDHLQAGRSLKSLKPLKDEQWIAFPELPGQRELSASHIASVYLAHKLGEINWSPVDSLTAQKRLVEAGFGIALMTRSSVLEELGARTLDEIKVPGLGAGQAICMVSRKGGFLSAAAKSVMELLRTQYMR
ncbi:MAG: LysR family transcriptional regulator [Pseudomonadota bacterium]